MVNPEWGKRVTKENFANAKREKSTLNVARANFSNTISRQCMSRTSLRNVVKGLKSIISKETCRSDPRRDAVSELKPTNDDIAAPTLSEIPELLWYDLIVAYTARSVTRSTDTLPAVSGLASLFWSAASTSMWQDCLSMTFIVV
jgi:hypothetical protein